MISHAAFPKTNILFYWTAPEGVPFYFYRDQSCRRSDQLLLVDHQLELQAQLLRRLAAEDHALQEDLKIIHDGAEVRIDGELQLDERPGLVDLQLRLGDGIIHPVVDIEAADVGVAHTAAAHIGFVRQNQRRGHGVHRDARALVVVADGGGDGGDLLRIKASLVQDAEGHDGAALAVVHPVHQVADVVEIGGDLCHLHRPLRMIQRLQDIACHFRHMGHMGKAVLRIAQSDEGFVRLGDIGADGRILADLFISHHCGITPPA